MFCANQAMQTLVLWGVLSRLQFICRMKLFDYSRVLRAIQNCTQAIFQVDDDRRSFYYMRRRDVHHPLYLIKLSSKNHGLPAWQKNFFFLPIVAVQLLIKLANVFTSITKSSLFKQQTLIYISFGFSQVQQHFSFIFLSFKFRN